MKAAKLWAFILCFVAVDYVLLAGPAYCYSHWNGGILYRGVYEPVNWLANQTAVTSKLFDLYIGAWDSGSDERTRLFR
jgi:hypothetical protein